MIEYQVSPVRSDYVSGEEVEIEVRIANHRPVAIEIPDPEMMASVQPAHRLTGPAWPEGIRFTNTHLLASGSPQDAASQKLIAIKPGAAWTGRFSLSSIINATAPGQYELTSNLNWGDVQAESQASAFRVEAMRVTSAHFGLGIRPFDAGEGEGAFIQHGSASSQIYSFTFQELRPAIAEAVADKPLHRFTAGPNATDIAVPWRKAPFFNELVRWIVWREGRDVKALSMASQRPVSLSLPTDLSRLVLPPLKVTGGPVEVLAVSQDGSTLSLVEFTGKPGEEGSGRLVWNSPLPAKPVGITAALEGDTQGSYRHIAFVAERAAGFEIFHTQFRPGGPPPSFDSVGIASLRPIPSADPALFIEPDGRARVGVLATAEGDNPIAELVETAFAGKAAAAEPSVMRLGELSGKVAGGALLYIDKKGVLLRRAGVIEMEDKRLFKLDANLKLAPANPGTPTHKILLAPGKTTTYILCIDSARGLYIEAL